MKGIMMISITPTLAIDESDVHEEFVRSSGPGGQNVNKVATAVQLRFNVARLPDEVRHRLLTIARSRITDDGILIITAKQFRTQQQNRHAALDLLVELIRQAAQPPKPHFKTKPTRASKERRLNAKRHTSEIKRLRRTIDD